MQTIPLALPSLPEHADPSRTRLGRPDRPARSAPPRERRASAPRLGWKARLALDGTGLVLFLAAIVAWPPLSDCRSKAYHVGLYAGDTVEKCTRRGIAARIDRADQRIKMLVRGSGR